MSRQFTFARFSSSHVFRVASLDRDLSTQSSNCESLRETSRVAPPKWSRWRSCSSTECTERRRRVIDLRCVDRRFESTRRKDWRPLSAGKDRETLSSAEFRERLSNGFCCELDWARCQGVRMSMNDNGPVSLAMVKVNFLISTRHASPIERVVKNISETNTVSEDFRLFTRRCHLNGLGTDLEILFSKGNVCHGNFCWSISMNSFSREIWSRKLEPLTEERIRWWDFVYSLPKRIAIVVRRACLQRVSEREENVRDEQINLHFFHLESSSDVSEHRAVFFSSLNINFREKIIIERTNVTFFDENQMIGHVWKNRLDECHSVLDSQQGRIDGEIMFVFIPPW